MGDFVFRPVAVEPHLGRFVFKRVEIEQHYRRGLELSLGVARDFPAEPRAELNLAVSRSDLAGFLLETGRPDEAENLISHALPILHADAKRTDEIQTWNQVYKCFLLMGAIKDRRQPRCKEAADYFQQAKAILRRQGSNYVNEANIRYHHFITILISVGRIDETIELCREAIALKVDHCDTHKILGRCLINLRRPDEAIDAFRNAVRLHNSADHHCDLGLALMASGRDREAAASFREAIPLVPIDPFCQHNLAWFLATSPIVEHRDPKKAVEYARKAVDGAPKTGGYWNTLGVAQYVAGNWKEAIAALTKSRELSNGDEEALGWLFLAMAHHQLGDSVQAIIWYGRANDWIDKKKPKREYYARYRGEARELLGIKNVSKP